MIQLGKSLDMDGLVSVSLGTDKGRWWCEDTTVGSEIWRLRQRGRLTKETLALFRGYVLAALEWLTIEGLAKEVTVIAEIDRQRINYRITITSPEGGSGEVAGVFDGGGMKDRH